ncbi:CLUMA_CG017739, isoform A [Clunio marinus]|uniref:CLUMA_CG017739, isoform A n=1 Tax=Clunio marinus TaxID=568069 RepID=A0A1J1IWL3_9DIPT|nr:CLUMA_CG017739, isoform A [Clunio marinus]
MKFIPLRIHVFVVEGFMTNLFFYYGAVSLRNSYSLFRMLCLMSVNNYREFCLACVVSVEDHVA